MKITFQHINGESYKYSVTGLDEADAILNSIIKNLPTAHVSFYRKEFNDFVCLLPEFVNKCTICIAPETNEDAKQIRKLND